MMIRKWSVLLLITASLLVVAASPASAAVVGNRRTKVFHNSQRAHCKAILDKLNSTRKRKFASRIKAIRENFKPCPRCKPIAWVNVKTLSGNTNQASDIFTLLGSKTKLTWTVESELWPFVAIYLMDSDKSLDVDGGFPVTMVTTAGSGETFVYKPAGSYYLDVSAANSTWTVSVTEAR